MEHKIIKWWSQGSHQVQGSIMKVIRMIEGLPEPKFTAEELMNIYTIIYEMCNQKPPYQYDHKLYDTYRETFEEYLTLTMLHSLRPLQPDESLLNQLTKAWENNMVMERLMTHFFHYLDNNFATRKSLPSLKQVAFHCFRDSVYLEVRDNARDAVIGLIHKEREGENIDRELVKKVIDIFVEIGDKEMDAYEQDFEPLMLKNTGEYYSRKASSWILEGLSDEDYRLKADECLAKERDTVSHYISTF